MRTNDPAASAPLRVVLYSRRDCHLCVEAERVLGTVAGAVTFEVEKIDIDDFRFLKRFYSEEVPVVWLQGEKLFKYRVDPDILLRRLGAAKTRPAGTGRIGRRHGGAGDAIRSGGGELRP